MSLLISKSTAKNFADADLEINNKKKKNFIAADSKIDS
jgi:hypothetical protein